MLYFVFTTGRCNLRCTYCGGSIPPSLVPWEVRYSVDALKSFLSDDPDPVIAFYGGEPLLNPSFIETVMDSMEARYVIQTNGLLVKELGDEYWRRMEAVLLSIDGREHVNDYYRGRGVYRAVLEAAKWLRKVGFRGDLIARMTISERSDVYEDVVHLLFLGLFDHVHWQLNVIWSPPWLSFDEWASSYVRGLRRLRDLWLRKASEGKVLGVVPFLAVISALLGLKTISSPPCESGINSVAILTNGKVIACPIAFDAPWAYLGDIFRHKPNDLIGKVKIGEPCTSCSYFPYCGGRCLYAYKERLWGEEGFRKVCSLTKALVDALREVVPEVKRLLRRGIIREEDLIYPPFNNTTELIP